MPDWITYRLSDFLLFSARTYYRMFELYHQEIWPAQAVLVALAVALMLMLRRDDEARGRAIGALLALSWIWVAIVFHLGRYAEINWAARYFAGLFIVQGGLLLWHCVVRRRLPVSQATALSGRIFSILLVISLVLEAIAGLADGRTWRQLEFAGVTPDATVIATLLVLCCPALRAPRTLLVIPILWCAIGGATLWAIGSSEAWAILLAGTVGLAAIIRMPGRGSPVR